MATAQRLKTHCPQGHPYDEENTLVSGGRRHCRICGRRRNRDDQAALRRAAGISERIKYESDGDLIRALCAEQESGCWLWAGTMHADGYGQFGKPMRLAHRISYEYFVGPIPDGLTLDHLCRVRSCVNPAHLEPVTIGENVLRGESPPARNARKTHCPKGHPYDEFNTYFTPSTGWRRCRTCIRERNG